MIWELLQEGGFLQAVIAEAERDADTPKERKVQLQKQIERMNNVLEDAGF